MHACSVSGNCANTRHPATHTAATALQRNSSTEYHSALLALVTCPKYAALTATATAVLLSELATITAAHSYTDCCYVQ